MVTENVNTFSLTKQKLENEMLVNLLIKLISSNPISGL